MTAQGTISGDVDVPIEGTTMDDRETMDDRKSVKNARGEAVSYRSLFSDEYRAKHMGRTFEDHYDEAEEREKERCFDPSRQVKVVDGQGRTRILRKSWATGVAEKCREEEGKRPNRRYR